MRLRSMQTHMHYMRPRSLRLRLWFSAFYASVGCALRCVTLFFLCNAALLSCCFTALLLSCLTAFLVCSCCFACRMSSLLRCYLPPTSLSQCRAACVLLTCCLRASYVLLYCFDALLLYCFTALLLYCFTFLCFTALLARRSGVPCKVSAHRQNRGAEAG
jgi:hypothetical protein